MLLRSDLNCGTGRRSKATRMSLYFRSKVRAVVRLHVLMSSYSHDVLPRSYRVVLSPQILPRSSVAPKDPIQGHGLEVDAAALDKLLQPAAARLRALIEHHRGDSAEDHSLREPHCGAELRLVLGVGWPAAEHAASAWDVQR